MAEHKMTKGAALQAYFSKRVIDLVIKHGKHPVGWDEILNPDLPEDRRGSILARAAIAVESGERRLPGYSFRRAVPRSVLPRLLSLRHRSHESASFA